MCKNREGFYVTAEERECTKCGTVFPNRSKTVTLCGPCNSDRVKKTRKGTKGLWARARNRAKAKGIEFTISPQDIVVPNVCPYLGIPLKEHSGSSGGKPDSPALDRVDNSLGYIPSNIQVISHLANQMKASASKEQLVLFSRRVLEIFGND